MSAGPTKSRRVRERCMIFNVRASNQDDHGKNHAFIVGDCRRQWQIPSSVRLPERCSPIAERVSRLQARAEVNCPGMHRIRCIFIDFAGHRRNKVSHTMQFGEAGMLIRDARKKAGLTQAELARALGMSRATISKVENGIIEELGVRKLAQVCDRVGLEIVVQSRRPLTLHQAYDRNRQERRDALKATDATLAKLKPDSLG